MQFVATADGRRLAYEIHGDPSRTALVLLAGMGSDLAWWRWNVPTLAGAHRLAALDLPGNGGSEAPDEPMAMAGLAADVVTLMDALAIDRAHLYGQSLGGMVAMEMALANPERVRSLILAATHAGVRRMVRPSRGDRVPKDRPYLALYSEGFAARYPERVAEDVHARHAQPPRARRRQWEAIRGWDAWDRVGAIACPVLVVHGTDDRLVPVENARRLAARIPGARLAILEGAGHVAHRERPEESDRLVLAFLREVDGR